MPIFNEADMLENVSGDTECVQMIVNSFYNDLSMGFPELKQALADHNERQSRDICHTLGGASGTTCSPLLAKDFENISKAVKTANWREALLAYDVAEKNFGLVTLEIKKYLE